MEDIRNSKINLEVVVILEQTENKIFMITLEEEFFIN